MKVGFISLGCSKNLVDTEMMIGLFKNKNYVIENRIEEAEIIVINTCGFIESAKEEAIETIFETIKYKETGKCKYLIVVGCLVERYKENLEKEIPEVDLFLKVSEYENLSKKVFKLIEDSNSDKNNGLQFMDRVITTGNNTAYLKIAEGCSNHCTYCAIPSIRGEYRSRKFEDIVEEAKLLVKKGYKEIILIAQDTTKYGIDIYGKLRLTELLNEISKIENLVWVRFLYAYPESITEELIQEVKNNEKVCKYFDIPIQHISNKVLKRMNRKGTKEDILNVINSIKTNIPEAIIRTTLIVGFPGETKEDYEELYNLVKNIEFDKLGVFSYSKEEGTPAANFKDQIHYKTKKYRNESIMKLQAEINYKKMKNYIGKNYIALIEDITKDGKFYIARTYMDSPDVDGITYISTKNIENKINLKGQFVDCKITDSSEYDLFAELQ